MHLVKGCIRCLQRYQVLCYGLEFTPCTLGHSGCIHTQLLDCDAMPPSSGPSASSVIGHRATIPSAACQVEQQRCQDKCPSCKPYQCQYCPYSTAYHTNLTNHERTHTGEKPFQCTICSKSFNQRSHQRTHMLTHTGEKRYRCTMCPKRFTKQQYQLSHMKVHMLQVHGRLS